MKIKTKYKIWHKGKLVPAFCRKPKNHKVLLLTARTIDEIKKGIRYILQEATK